MFGIGSVVLAAGGETANSLGRELLLLSVLIFEFAGGGILFLQAVVLSVRTAVNRDDAKYWRSFVVGGLILVGMAILEHYFIQSVT
jgi:hypothetical protein